MNHPRSRTPCRRVAGALLMLAISAQSLAAQGASTPAEIRMTYDEAGALESLQMPTGRTLVYENSARGLPREMRYAGALVLDAAGYGVDGQLETLRYAAQGSAPGRTASFGYDSLSRPSYLSLASNGATTADYRAEGFQYDERGFVTQYRRDDRLVGSTDIAYTYSGQGQLLTFDWGGSTTIYRYDGRGNLDLRSGALGIPSLPATSFDLQTQHRQGWLYDEAGRLLQDDRYRYLYNDQGRLARLDDLATGQWEAHYLYDTEGRRVRTLTADRATVVYRDPDGAVLSEETLGRSGERLEAKDYADFAGRPALEVVLEGGSEKRWLRFADRLGSPALMWRDGEEKAHEYSPFGHRLAVGGAVEHEGAFGFTGHEDDATGLVYMQARYLDPLAARFNAPDPARDYDVHLPATLNLYQYAHNNPINRIDTDGRQSEPVIEVDLENLKGEVAYRAGTFRLTFVQSEDGIQLTLAANSKASLGGRFSASRGELPDEGGVAYFKAYGVTYSLDLDSGEVRASTQKKPLKASPAYEGGVTFTLRKETDLTTPQSYDTAYRTNQKYEHVGGDHGGEMRDCTKDPCGERNRRRAEENRRRRDSPSFLHNPWKWLKNQFRSSRQPEDP